MASFTTRLGAVLGAACLGLALASAPARAQTPVVQGTVIDASDGQALPGVNVRVEGTAVGTTTDLDGQYTLELPPDQRLLVFTFVGYRTLEIEVPENQPTLDVAMEEDVLGLDEVVVTGLASSVERANLANSVATISAAELAGATTSQTLDGALAGKFAGAEISSYTGAPGGGISVKLRGISTINGNSQPLYVVDGVIVDNSAISSNVNAVTAAAAAGSAVSQDNPVNRIADLNPEDIESIEILKGASAAAIYGGRASNGVVIITTKRGRAGETRVNFAQSLGFATISNSLGTRAFTEETAIETYAPPAPGPAATPDEIAEFEAGVERIRQLFRDGQARGFVDYEEELFGQEGLLLTTNLSVSGGTEQTQFFVSGQLKDDEGIVERTGYEKQSIRANLDHTLSSRARVSVSSNYIRTAARRGLTGNDNSGTTFGVSLTATPSFIELRPDEDGNYPDHPLNASNPLQTRDLFTNEEVVDRFLVSGRATYNLLTTESQALQFIAEGGVDSYSLVSEALFPRFLQFERISAEPGTSIRTEANTLNVNVRGLLVHTYNVPGQNFSFSTQVGVTGVNLEQDRTNVVARNLITGQQNINQAGSITPDQEEIFQRDRSFFAQEEINFNDRVIVTAGLRGDRSTINGDVNEFFLYPKASLAVNLTEFPFWGFEPVNQFKLRGAFGQTGNIAAFGTKYTSFDPTSISGNIGALIQRQRGFDDIKPERQTEFEGGFDLGLFDGRANLEFTGYYKRITDQLLQREVPPSTGFGSELINAGTLVNRGLEIGVTLLPVNTRAVRWTSQTNFWTNDAEVTDLPVPAFTAVGGGFGASLGIIQIEEGESPTQIVGIDDRIINETGEPGADGIDDGTYQLGDVAPDFQMSFLNNVALFGNFELSFLFHWKFGGDNLNLSELLFDLNGTSPDYDELTRFNQFVQSPDDDIFANEGVAVVGDCPVAADEAYVECTFETRSGPRRVSLLGVSAEPFVQNASYFRLREVGVYYTLPPSLLQSALGDNVSSLRVGVSANNLFTITPYKSYDPEVNNFGTQPVATGVEVTPFPSSRQFLFHLNVVL